MAFYPTHPKITPDFSLRQLKGLALKKPSAKAIKKPRIARLFYSF
jgi:hypothetical protein